MANHYNVLAIQRGATIDEVKKAYRALQIKHHPDKTGHLPEEERAKSAALSQAANVAYEVLSDPLLRSAYDRTLLASLSKPSSACSGGSNCATQTRRSAPKPPSPPPSLPQKLNVSDSGWRFDIHIGEAYEPYNWGPGLVFTSEHKVFLFLKVRKRKIHTLQTPDVRLSVAATPRNCAIYKIESLLRHLRTPEGPEEQLLVTIFTSPCLEGGLPSQQKGSPPRFNFAWQLEPYDIGSMFRPPWGVQTWGSCLVFLTAPPSLAALFNGATPSHADDPRCVLLQDKGLQSKTGKACEVTHMQCAWGKCSCATTTKVAWDRDGQKMYRLVSFGWQPKGKGKGESD